MNRKLAYILIISLLSCNGEEAKEETPRQMNGRTTLSTDDSVYFITFKIDSVLEREYEPEEDYDPRR